MTTTTGSGHRAHLFSTSRGEMNPLQDLCAGVSCVHCACGGVCVTHTTLLRSRVFAEQSRCKRARASAKLKIEFFGHMSKKDRLRLRLLVRSKQATTC